MQDLFIFVSWKNRNKCCLFPQTFSDTRSSCWTCREGERGLNPITVLFGVFHCPLSVNSPWVVSCAIEAFYYIDASVVTFIRNYIRDASGVFSISSLVRILMTSFPAFHGCLCSLNSRWKIASDRFVYIIKRKLHGGLKIWILFFSCWKQYLTLSLSQILFLPLENKIHIFAPPCNILYVSGVRGGGELHWSGSLSSLN